MFDVKGEGDVVLSVLFVWWFSVIELWVGVYLLFVRVFVVNLCFEFCISDEICCFGVIVVFYDDGNIYCFIVGCVIVIGVIFIYMVEGVVFVRRIFVELIFIVYSGVYLSFVLIIGVV